MVSFIKIQLTFDVLALKSNMNSEITPLGGKTALGTSEVSARELREFKAYRNATEAVVKKHGAINTAEAAHDLRTVIAAYMSPDVSKTMTLLGYTFDKP